MSERKKVVLNLDSPTIEEIVPNIEEIPDTVSPVQIIEEIAKTLTKRTDGVLEGGSNFYSPYQDNDEPGQVINFYVTCPYLSNYRSSIIEVHVPNLYPGYPLEIEILAGGSGGKKFKSQNEHMFRTHLKEIMHSKSVLEMLGALRSASSSNSSFKTAIVIDETEDEIPF